MGTGDDLPLPEKPSGRLIGKRDAAESAADGGAVTQALPAQDAHANPSADFVETAFLDPSATPAVRSRESMEIPTQLGVYQVERELARGGMGVVLEGIHPQLKRRVAIKLLRADVASDDPQAHDRFMREARATAKLRHPGIVAIHDVGEDEQGRTYLVMDYVQGDDLKALLDQGRLPLKRAAELMQKVAEAVAHAHEHGILHRDLKPHNVLLDERSGEPLLTDFGLAKTVGRKTHGNSSKIVLRPASGRLKIDDAQLTQDGEVMGTPLYMSPEQIDASRGKITTKTDVWALGVMLYELLTNRTPFDRDSVWNIFDAILKEQPTPPGVLRGEVPEELEAIVMRCLEKSPLARYSSARAVAKDLARFLEGAPVLGRTHRSAPQPSSSRLLPLVALAGLVLLGGLLVPAEVKGRVSKAVGVLLGRPPSGAPAPPARPSPPPPMTSVQLPPKLPTGVERPTGTPEVPDERPSPAPSDLEERATAGEPMAMLALGVEILEGRRPGDSHHALQLIRDAAKAGVENGYWILGRTEIDLARKQEAYEAGAAAGDARCMRHLINQCLENSSDSSLRSASRWLEQLVAVEPQSVDSRMTLANLNGHTAWGDRALAKTQWGAAYELGAKGAAMKLANIYRREGDDGKARKWLETAAGDGNAEAHYVLGQAYELGRLGVQRKPKRARSHYIQAQGLGHEGARERLKAMAGGRRGRG